MWRRVKRYLQLISGLFLSSITLLAGYIFLQATPVDLGSSAKCKGQITNVESSSHFIFQLADISHSFSVFRPSHNYDDLHVSLHIGDTVTVYFPAATPGNTPVYQVEKDGQVIVDKELLQGQNLAGGLIGLLGGLGLLAGSIWHFKKHRL